MIPNGSAQHRIRRFQGIQQRAECDRIGHLDLRLAADSGELAQVEGQDDANGHELTARERERLTGGAQTATMRSKM